ncbi:MAG: capsule assembly Wzi family protein [bacterium]|nr:capsule assembly Wzi family protein [bacterium]
MVSNRYLIILCCLGFFCAFPVYANLYPTAFQYTPRLQMLLDEGNLWYYNSTFLPLQVPKTAPSRMFDHSIYRSLLRYTQTHQLLCKEAKDGFSSYVFPTLGISRQDGTAKRYEKLAIQPILWAEGYYHNWYAKLFVRVSNEANSLEGFSGQSRSIRRAGMNASEVDQSVIGYRNEWANVEYGRTREIWGPYLSENMFLSTNAPPYERLMLELTYKRFRYRWFYGYLESLYDASNQLVHRYLVGRCLEYRNRKNLVVSFGEFSTLAGPNRPVDLSFLNPIAAHLEVEQNKRTNDPNGNHANNLLYASFDWMVLAGLRISGAVGLDELQIDFQDRKQKEADQLLYNGRIAYTPIMEPFTLTLLGNLYYSDTYSLQHSYRYTNFVSRNQPLGHPLANDAEEYRIGVRLSYNRFPMVLTTEYGYSAWGDSSIANDPYRPYHSTYRTKHPAGTVRENRFVRINLDTEWIERLNITVNGQLDLKHRGPNSQRETWTIAAQYAIPFTFTSKDEPFREP